MGAAAAGIARGAPTSRARARLTQPWTRAWPSILPVPPSTVRRIWDRQRGLRNSKEDSVTTLLCICGSISVCVSVCRRAVRLTPATGHGTVPAMTDMVSGPHVHAQADGAIVSEEELKLLRALEQLWQQKLGEKDEEVARLSGRLRRAETERDVLRNSLRAVWARLGEEPRGPSPGETQVEPSPVPTESAMTSFDTGGTPREGIAARAMAPTGGRFRSPEVVARVVREAGRPLTRTEIREEMERRGLIPTTWANPQNATSTATLRAKQRGLIVEVMPGSFGPPPELSTDAGWA